MRAQIPYLQELGVTYLHLMPLLASRPGDDDGGYAVGDHRRVRAELGDVADLRALAADLRAAGISLVLDLVLNHVAREHPWAVAAREGSARHRAYFRVFPDRTEPDAYEQTLPEVFPDFAPGSFTFDPDLQGWVWTTFNSFQWDLDWSNPDVLVEMTEVVLFLAGLGVEVLRLDAIAFLWKRLGTSCQNQPEVHAITQALRAVARIACPAVAFKAEAIVGPQDLVQYLGVGGAHRQGERPGVPQQPHGADLVDARGRGRGARRARPAQPAGCPRRARPGSRTPAATTTSAGRSTTRDAAAVGLSGPAHRAFLSDWYSGAFTGSTARGLVFQENPDTGDRRVSGTAASLAGVAAARGGDGDLDLAVAPAPARARPRPGLGRRAGGLVRRRARAAGRPRLVARARARGRQPLGAPATAAAGRAGAPARPGDRRGAGVRRAAAPGRGAGRPAAAARRHVPPEVLDLADPGVLPVLRDTPAGPLLGLYNVTRRLAAVARRRPWPSSGCPSRGTRSRGERLPLGGDGLLWLAPYRAVWLVAPRA